MFVGTKMMLTDLVKMPIGISLGVVVGILVATMVLSLRCAPKKQKQPTGAE